MNNKTRAARARKAVRQYIGTTQRIDRETLECGIVDLLTDLMHLTDQSKLTRSIGEMYTSATQHHFAEKSQ